MRNVDKIKGLENQVEYLRDQLRKTREQNTEVVTANAQLRQMIDAVIVEIAKRYGERREEDGVLLGYRLVTGKADVKDTLENWEIRVEDQGDDRVIGVFPREKEEPHDQNDK